jgi:hypothetical protein
MAMRTLVYLLGLLVILGAFAWAAVLLDIPKSWVGVGLLLGLGIILVKLARDMSKHSEP